MPHSAPAAPYPVPPLGAPSIAAQELQRSIYRQVRLFGCKDWLSWAYGVAIVVTIAALMYFAPILRERAQGYVNLMRARMLNGSAR